MQSGNGPSVPSIEQELRALRVGPPPAFADDVVAAAARRRAGLTREEWLVVAASLGAFAWTVRSLAEWSVQVAGA